MNGKGSEGLSASEEGSEEDSSALKAETGDEGSDEEGHHGLSQRETGVEQIKGLGADIEVLLDGMLERAWVIDTVCAK